MVNAMPQPLTSWESDPIPIVWDAGWAPGLLLLLSGPRAYAPDAPQPYRLIVPP